jgi:multicomponent Na+:H+ antiporter subunit G
MIDIVKIASYIFISIGCFIMAIAALGLYRFPDVYMRLHASAKITTGGAMNIFFGLMLRFGFQIQTVKIFVLLLLIFILAPVVSHAIARSAHHQGKTDLIPFLSHSKDKEKFTFKNPWRKK